MFVYYDKGGTKELEAIRRIIRVLLSIVKYILGIIIIFILTMGIIVMTTSIQSAIFVPDEFIIWVAHDSGIRMAFIFEFIFILLFFYFMNRKKFDLQNILIVNIFTFTKKHIGISIAVFASILIMTIYYMVVNISVISSDKIVNHTFFMPQGKEYLYTDVKFINTGVYGSNKGFRSHKGTFYYIIELSDGTKIDLNNTGEIKDGKDTYQTIMEIDKVFKENRISKNVDDRYFGLCQRNLAKRYSDKIKTIFENVN